MRSLARASFTTTGRRVSRARAFAGTSRRGCEAAAWKAAHCSGTFRPSAYCDTSGVTWPLSHSSSVQRSTRHTWAIFIATRLSSRFVSSVELRISTTSSSAPVSSRRRAVSE